MIKKAGSLFVTAYLLLIFGVYPFYMKEGYVDIGEGKYEFFLYCSLGALLILTVISLFYLGQTLYNNFRSKKTYLIDWEKVSLSVTDMLVFMYLALISLSSVLSDFRQEAVWGVEGWRMGLIVWMVLCGLYFFVSRLWNGGKVVWTIAILASAVVFFLGITDSFSLYMIPLEIRESGFISTLGNINWFCGYLSVLAPVGICVWFFHKPLAEENNFGKLNWKAAGLLVYTVIAFMAGLCQGSNSVFLWFGGLFFVLLWIGAERKDWLKRWFFMVFLWGISGQLIRICRILFPGKYNYDLNNLCGLFTETNVSLWIAVIALLCYLCMAWIQRKTGGMQENAEETVSNHIKTVKRTRRIQVAILVAVILCWVMLSAVNTWTSFSGFLDAGLFRWNESWGNGRGAALKAGFQMFGEMSFVQKLFGVGPDCFASYAYSIDEVATGLREYFGASRLTNAHSEPLTSLVNVGILGAASYFGIFISFVVRCFKRGALKPEFYIPAVCVIGYLCHNLVSFAQVLNLPFVILIMAMGEGMLRRGNE